MSDERAIFCTQPDSSRVLSRAARRAGGVYYTPPELVEAVLDLVQPALAQAAGACTHVLDPACGAGEFLVGAAKRLAALRKPVRVVGVDVDAAAAAVARGRLSALGTDAEIHVGDGLARGRLEEAAFDLIVGNPPYVSIRELAKSRSAAEIGWLREQFQTARGNFDLYVLFIERAIALLKPGGWCALLVPNKWATLDYARSCRAMLLARTTIEHVVDLAGWKAFGAANVYPQVLVFRKGEAGARHCVSFSSFAGAENAALSLVVGEVGEPPRREGHEGGVGGGASAVRGGASLERRWRLQAKVRQQGLSAAGFSFGDAFEVEGRAATLPLAEVARIGCGTAGYVAQKIARRLTDYSPALPRSESRCFDFITSGNIHRYAIDAERVRFLGRDYDSREIALEIPEFTTAKRRLITQAKIVVAGMSRRIEAAVDMGGRALGVQAFAVYEPRVDLHYLLGVLNSKLMSYLFATRFAGKRLGGGYLAVNKGQLARLPVRVVDAGEAEESGLVRRIAKLARLAGPNCGAVDAEIDRRVYELYRVSAEEVLRVEAFFGVGRVAA